MIALDFQKFFDNGGTMLNLQRVETFRAVVDAGSLSAAALSLGQTRAMVSFNLKRLEAELGVALLARSTRRLALTEAGERFYRQSVALLASAQQAIDEARADDGALSGTLRITTTPEYAQFAVAPALRAFGRLHPQLALYLSTSTSQADLISERFDLAIRLGRADDSSHHAARLAQFEIRPVAAPKLLQERPIRTLAQLCAAPWLSHSRLDGWMPWKVDAPDGRQRVYRPEQAPVFRSDSAAVLRDFALDGSGVAMLPSWLIGDALKQGHLINLLPRHRFARQEVYALYPRTRHIPSKVRALIDFLKGC